MFKFNKYKKVMAFSIATVAATVLLSVSSYARITSSIFGDETPVSTAAAGMTRNPAVSEQVRYSSDKVPSVELEQLLVEAEKAAANLIEEHNRRIDIMSLQESYLKNLQSRDIYEAAKLLLDEADACNGRQMGLIFSCASNNYYPGYVNLPNILSGDRWGGYPKLCGAAVWTQGLKRRLLGTYTEELNREKAQRGIWWGGVYDPILADSLFRKMDDKTKAKLTPEVNKAWQDLINSVKKKVGAPGYFIDTLVRDRNVVPPTMATYIDDQWISSYDPTSNEWGSAQRMKEYRKARWLVGYQFLMDIYHNEMFGAIANKGARLWPDQKTRYTNEILENFFRYYESHYRSSWISPVQRPNPVIETKSNYDEWDYYNHLSNSNSGFRNKIANYQRNWHRRHSAKDSYSCCRCCRWCSCGKYCSYCCSCCPGETKLMRCPVDQSLDGPNVSRRTYCPNDLRPHPDLSVYPATTPHPLINNSNVPAVMESVYIDAEIKDGEYQGYKLETFAGSPILARNGSYDGSKFALPNVWYNKFMTSIPSAVYAYNGGGAVAGDGRFSYRDAATYNSSKVPNVLTFYKPTGAGLSPNYVSFGRWLPNYASIASAIGTLANNSNFPFNQNRISVYLDIYEEFVKARDNMTKLTGPYGANAQLDKTLVKMLERQKQRSEEGFYDVNGKQTKEEWKFFMNTSYTFSNAQGIDKLYDESMQRENWFLAQARDLLKQIGVAIRKEQNRDVYNYQGALEAMYDSTPIEEPDDDGDGPSIPGDQSSEKQFLYRVGRVYQTLAYFGGQDTVTGPSVEYKPNLSAILKAMSLFQYSPTVMNRFEANIEKIRYDGNFTVPPVPNKGTPWLQEGGSAHTSRPIVEKAELENPQYKGNYIQIGPLASLAPQIRGKTLRDLEEGKDMDDLLEKLDEQRTERLNRYKEMLENREYWAKNFNSELKGSASGIDFTFTVKDFNTTTCLFKHRSSTSL